MASLILCSTFDKLLHARDSENLGSVKKIVLNRSKKCARLRRSGTIKHKSRVSGELLQQLDACYEELNIAIMAELADRERINQELRENVHAKFDYAREVIANFQGSEKQQNLFTSQLSKLEGLASDRTKRLKSDTLRRLLDSTQILVNKIQKISEPSEIVQTEASSYKHADSPIEPVTSVSVVPNVASSKNETSQISDLLPSTEVSKPVESETPPVKVSVESETLPVKASNPPVVVHEVISEEAKLKQKAQIPWRTPSRLEPDVQEANAKEDVNCTKIDKKPTSSVEPCQTSKPERLALRYPMKTKKRVAEDKPDADILFKKPLPMPPESQKPLFQRRHQLPPTGPAYSKRDPRNYGDYCRRRQMQYQNRARFENQNQQYYRQHPAAVSPNPMKPSRTFAVSAPPPVRPTTMIAPCPTAPKAVVMPTVAKPPTPKSPTNVAVTVRPENRKTNPVYSNNEPIALGKKELPKKIIASTKTTEKAKVEEPKKVEQSKTDQVLKTGDSTKKIIRKIASS